MKKGLSVIGIMVTLIFVLSSCGCEHEYNEEIVKEATYTSEGEKVFTCKNCGHSYSEVIPVRDEEVMVTAVSKTNLGKDYDAGRFSNRVEFVFEVTNQTDKPINR